MAQEELKSAQSAAPDLMTEIEFCQMIGLSPSAVARRRARGMPPEYIKIGKSVRYSRQVVEEFLQSCTVKPRRKRGAR